MILKCRQNGFGLIGVLILTALAGVAIGGLHFLVTSDSHAGLETQIRAREYYKAEDTLARAASWMRGQSTKLVSPFSRTNFYTRFDRTALGYGSNDTSTFRVGTKIKLQGTTNSAILTNDSGLATAAFPTTTDTLTATSFNPATQFPLANLGDDKVRVTLIDAVPVNPSADYGDTDTGAAAPGTDFQPIYRVDSMKSLTGGGHVVGYLTGNLVFNYGVGFYGRDFVEMRQPCDSYLSNSGSYTSASKRANCPLGSNATVYIHNSTSIYGSARTNGSFATGSPWGGRVCSDFASGCPNAGSTCAGASCQVPNLPTYSTWATYCPTNMGNQTYNANTTVTIANNNPSSRCWNTFTVGNNRTVTLSTTNYSYYIDTLDIPNNATLRFLPSPSNGTINLYVRKFVGDKFNGNQVISHVDANGDGNPDYRPYQVRIHYLGTDALVLNGSARMGAFLVAPYADVSVQGTFDYYGGMLAKSLTATGTGGMHYDESGNITTLSDIQYRIRNVGQYYR
jgi:hypothetical protein